MKELSKISIFNNCFKNKNVIVTGHTGFKGSWLSLWLKTLGANVRGISLDPITHPSHYKVINLTKKINDRRCNILNKKKLEKEIISFKPHFIFHLAAQSLVNKSLKFPHTTWETNVIGTINILECLRKIEHKCVGVIITSDKCYENKEILRGYKEDDELGGVDPYSASKGSAELAIRSYIKSYFSSKKSKVRIAIGRAGNVIGGGDWSEDRILPDCIKSWSKNKKVVLRNPESTRPWQHVLEPLSGYLILAKNLNQNTSLHGEAFNFGPRENVSRTVIQLVKEMSIYWKNVQWDIKPNKKLIESKLLKLNCKKSKKILGWESNLNFQQTIRFTAEWYKNYYKDKVNAEKISKMQIMEFTKLARANSLNWAK